MYGILPIITTIFATKRTGAEFTRIGEQVGLAESTTHSYLDSLIDQKVVLKGDSERAFGLRFHDVGGRIRERADLHEATKPQFRNLYAKTGRSNATEGPVRVRWTVTPSVPSDV